MAPRKGLSAVWLLLKKAPQLSFQTPATHRHCRTGLFLISWWKCFYFWCSHHLLESSPRMLKKNIKNEKKKSIFALISCYFCIEKNVLKNICPCCWLDFLCNDELWRPILDWLFSNYALLYFKEGKIKLFYWNKPRVKQNWVKPLPGIFILLWINSAGIWDSLCLTEVQETLPLIATKGRNILVLFIYAFF